MCIQTSHPAVLEEMIDNSNSNSKSLDKNKSKISLNASLSMESKIEALKKSTVGLIEEVRA